MRIIPGKHQPIFSKDDRFRHQYSKKSNGAGLELKTEPEVQKDFNSPYEQVKHKIEARGQAVKANKLQTQAMQGSKKGISSSQKPPPPQKPTIKTQPEPIVIVKSNKHNAHPVRASEVSPELLRIHGSWPFDLAPDELIIEEKRIIIKRNYFPVGGSVITLPVHTLTSFELNQAIVYSAIYIKGGEGNTVNTVMQWLKPEDAVRAKDIVDGLRLRERESIEIKQTDKQDFVHTLEIMGHT